MFIIKRYNYKEKVMSTTEKNVFISHHSKDDEHIDKLKELAKKNNYILKNSSIDSTKPNQANSPDYIKKILRDRIAWAGTMVVLIGKGTHAREYVNYEIEEANRQGKRIVGIHIDGESDAEVPEAFKKYGDTLVGWTSEKIIDAIEGENVGFQNPDGSPMTSEYTPERLKCT